MSQPTPYTPTTDFSQQEANNASGRSTVNTAALDAEFANLESTIDGLVSNIAIIQRDDGNLSDESVQVPTLSRDVLNLIGGFVVRGDWVTATVYSANDIIASSGFLYLCVTAHTSSASFGTDAAKWKQFGFKPSDGIAAAAAQAAIDAHLIDADGAHASTSISHGVGTVSSAISALESGKASLISPVFTGTPTAPTAPNGDVSSKVANTEFVANTIASTFGTSIKQIQPITASVASNAITVTLNPTTLDFRDASLTSGAVNTRTVGSAISITVPSTATLGTVNAVQNRLAVLAIDNAGTVELAVVNLAGGNDLTETGVITTTALSAAADSNNVIYSTTARTGVPYRVVGYVESTQATAGTWATAPSKIQGFGGQYVLGLTLYTPVVTPLPASGVALTGSHSLGFVPVEAVLELTCLTAEQGYSIGDVVQVVTMWNGSAFVPISTYKTSTSVGIPMPTGYLPLCSNKTTGISANYTSANWSYRFRLRAA